MEIARKLGQKVISSRYTICHIQKFLIIFPFTAQPSTYQACSKESASNISPKRQGHRWSICWSFRSPEKYISPLVCRKPGTIVYPQSVQRPESLPHSWVELTNLRLFKCLIYHVVKRDHTRRWSLEISSAAFPILRVAKKLQNMFSEVNIRHALC